jgi:hypothetical protein
MARPVTSTEHVRKNREHWEGESDAYQERNRSQLNRWDLLAWGVYDVPEDEIHALGDVAASGRWSSDAGPVSPGSRLRCAGLA